MAATTRWISSKRKATAWLLMLAAALVAGLASCDDGPTETQEPEDLGPDATVVFRGLTVSDVDDAAAGGSPLAAATPGVAYISACPGTFSDADSITITNLANGQTRTVEPIDGGFDPVAFDSEPDDPIEFVVHRSDGSTDRYMTRVPARKRPRVVRTVPPKDATDVVLSSSALAVFSEPVDASTVTAETFQLQLNGQPVEGTLALTPDGLRAEFIPAEPLYSGTTYLLLITTGVRDPEGDPLEAAVGTRFTTEGRVVFASVSAGGHHNCALAVNGSAYCWGINWYGELGLPAFDTAGPPQRVPTSYSFTSLIGRSHHTCSLDASGTARCWGGGGWGTLGNGHKTSSSSAPVPVSGNHSFASLATGDGYHSCGLLPGGDAYCWGWSPSGELGTPLTSETCIEEEGNYVNVYPCSSTPLPVVGGLSFTFLAASSGVRNRVRNRAWTGHTCGITVGGAAYCWGQNRSGQLGTATSDSCEHGRLQGEYWACSRTPLPVDSELSFTQLTGGGLHTCGIGDGGAAYCWGNNLEGQLGIGQIGGEYTTPVAVADARSYVSVDGGGYHTCGVTVSGDAYCWGWNASGQLGIGSEGGDHPEPVKVYTPYRFEAVTLGDVHTCALTTDGEVYCWGDNYYGQLGVSPSVTPQSGVPLRVEVP